jgi:glycosyltransferase involved in cell wall biosynthesis
MKNGTQIPLLPEGGVAVGTTDGVIGLLISVIVPVYNAEKYLARCVESILAQTLHNLELILVDDGSHDSSPAICDHFAALDPRVRVLHKPNGGVSAARNDGIETSRGQYIAFCDNDDFYAPGMLARLLDICVTNDAQIAQCALTRGTADSLPTPTPRHVSVFTNRQMLENFYTAGSPWIWNKLYHRSVWRDVRFPVGSHMYEDNIIIHRLYLAATRIASTPEILYYYSRNPESVTGRRFDIRWTSIPPYNDRIDMARAEQLPRLLANTLSTRLYNEACWLFMNRRYNHNPSSRHSFHVEHSALLRQYYREAMVTPGISQKHKALIILSRFTPLLYHLYNWFKWRILRNEPHVRFGEIK